MSKKKPQQTAPCLREFVRTVVCQYLDDMGNTPPDSLHRIILDEVEQPLIEAVLDHTGGNQSRAAEILGITRSTLRGRIRRYGIG